MSIDTPVGEAVEPNLHRVHGEDRDHNHQNICARRDPQIAQVIGRETQRLVVDSCAASKLRIKVIARQSELFTPTA
jgi:hypothetical protein